MILLERTQGGNLGCIIWDFTHCCTGLPLPPPVHAGQMQGFAWAAGHELQGRLPLCPQGIIPSAGKRVHRFHCHFHVNPYLEAQLGNVPNTLQNNYSLHRPWKIQNERSSCRELPHQARQFFESHFIHVVNFKATKAVKESCPISHTIQVPCHTVPLHAASSRSANPLIG